MTGDATARPAAYRSADGVAVVEDAGVVHVGDLSRDRIITLNATAAVIWRAATGAAARPWLAVVADTLEGEVEQIREDVEDFVDELVSAGWLVPTPWSDRSPSTD